MPIQYCSVMMKPQPISWRGDAILAKICWKTYPPGTFMDLKLLTFEDLQQPSYELLMRMTTPTSLTYKHQNPTD